MDTGNSPVGAARLGTRLNKAITVAAMALGLSATWAASADAAGLLDGSVTATNYSPDLSTVSGTPGSGPTTGIVDTNGFDFAFTADTITYTDGYTGDYTSVGPGGFNGFVLTFTGVPTISGVSLDPSSLQVPTDLYSTANQVFIEFNGGSQVAGQTSLIDVSFSPTGTVPEPAAWAMMLLGVGLIGARARLTRRNGGKVLAAA